MEASTAIRHTIGVIEFPALRPSSSRQLHRLKSFPSLPLQNRLVSPNFHRRLCIAEAASHHHHQEHSNHHHQDDHDHRHSHGHGHHNHHHHGDELQELTGAQRAVIRFADAVRWTDLASVLREHLQLCCCSAALFVAAAICPHLAPKSVAKPLQNSFMIVGFPLVGVSASLDALIEIAGGKVNIHVLMAMAAFASVFMGNALEGGLLLAMFNLAHIAEEFFTSRSLVDVKDLKENHPDSALVLDVKEGKIPDLSHLSYSSVPVHDIEVGSYVLVGAGEAVPVDCQIFQGTATITIEHLTGEAKPIEAKVGDGIPGGARNLDGRMIVKATKTWNESTLSRIVQLTEEAQQNRPKLQRWLDEFGEQYSKVVVGLSFAVAFLGPLLFKWPFMSTSACRGSIYRALGLMMAASPCALAVAPLVYATAISSCAKKGGIIMVGEGINDAPALAAATVGIVLARRASATAVAVADVLLLRDNISVVPFCIAKSRQTSNLVKQNVALALTSIILASLPSVLGFLPLWLTVLLHEGGTLLVCLNSVRALNEPKWSWKEDMKQHLKSRFVNSAENSMVKQPEPIL
ncbi:Probable cadmium/zinc-transporting ATPase HMA1, chloroplastic [Linum perenne]